MFWVVSYDIPNDKRRRKVSDILEGYGRRSQYSVFECDIDDAKRIKLEMRLIQVIDKDEDDVRFYPLNEADMQRVRLLGKAVMERKCGFYIIQSETGRDRSDEPF
ncbi:MAG: CRISPR-associated endonuclease Cas2 [Anaerolineae bacterium]|nr:CRISPR-associated endonuclease Cas2 [Anaerolineae bacterium]NUQ06908.1 CRISPR-associated endonuclease Cas2 [Anaerolineae bacterium]